MKPKLAVWKFSSCDGCQLTLLDCEDELLDIAEAVDIAYFLEATRTRKPGPYDISLVEGSVSTAHEVERIQDIRRDSRRRVFHGHHAHHEFGTFLDLTAQFRQPVPCAFHPQRVRSPEGGGAREDQKRQTVSEEFPHPAAQHQSI